MSKKTKKGNRHAATISLCTGAVMLAGGLVSVEAVIREARKDHSVKSAEHITGASLNSYNLLKACSDEKGRISVTEAGTILDLTPAEVNSLSALADRGGTVSYRDAAKVFHSSKSVREVRVDGIIAAIKRADTAGAFSEIEKLAKGRREMTGDTRTKLMEKYGLSAEKFDFYYNVATSVSKMPNGAHIGAVM